MATSESTEASGLAMWCRWIGRASGDVMARPARTLGERLSLVRGVRGRAARAQLLFGERVRSALVVRARAARGLA